MTKQALIGALLAAAFVATATASDYKMTTPIAPGVATPDTVETSIGTLKLNDGFPTTETIEKVYDNLDRSRALQAYLLAIPIVNQAGCAIRCASSAPTTRQTSFGKIWSTRRRLS